MSCDDSIAFSAKITSVGQKTFIILMKKASPRNGPVGEAFLLSFISEIHCSELLHIQILINQDAVDSFQVECNFAFRFQLDGEEIFRTFEHLFVSEIDESRIERLLTAGYAGGRMLGFPSYRGLPVRCRQSHNPVGRKAMRNSKR